MEEVSREYRIVQELDRDKPHLPHLPYSQSENDESIAMLHMMAEGHPNDGELHDMLFEKGVSPLFPDRMHRSCAHEIQT